MLVELFKGVSPRVIFLNFTVMAAVWVSPFLIHRSYSFPDGAEPMPLYKLLSEVAGSPSWGIVMAVIMIVIISWLLVNLNTSLVFLPERTLLPSVLFALFSGLFVQCQTLNPVLPAAIFLIAAFKRMMDAYRKNITAFCFFDSAILVGTGALFYSGLLWFWILLFAGVIILRGYNLKEILLSLAGLAVPFTITVGIYYVFSLNVGGLTDTFRHNLFSAHSVHDFNVLETAGLIASGISLLAGLCTLLPGIRNLKIKSRKIFILLLWWLFISLTLYIVSPAQSEEMIYLTAIPVSFFSAYFFLKSLRNIISDIIFLLLILSVAAIQAVQYF